MTVRATWLEPGVNRRFTKNAMDVVKSSTFEGLLNAEVPLSVVLDSEDGPKVASEPEGGVTGAEFEDFCFGGKEAVQEAACII